MPADGLKGKTWGPSTCHQKERGQIIRDTVPVTDKIWSKSAPNLEKHQALSRSNFTALREIGTLEEDECDIAYQKL